jgi:hypothetical protein
MRRIESELAAGFLRAHGAIEIHSGRLLGIDFDLVGRSAADSVLWFCEMTASGFLGSRNRAGRDRDFHVGASRKFCEGFAKFSVLRLKEREVREQLARTTGDPAILDAQIECRLVVPRDCRFVRALGWRRQLLESVMRVEEVDLSESSREAMIECLLKSRREQQRM